MYDEIYGEFEEHVKTGDVVWYCGDLVDPVEKIIVGPSRHSEERRKTNGRHCYEAVNSFWNKLYFSDYESAKKENWEYRAGYTDSFWLYGSRW